MNANGEGTRGSCSEALNQALLQLYKLEAASALGIYILIVLRYEAKRGT